MERGYNLNIRINKNHERFGAFMDTASYYGMIISVLIGITFIALIFAFLYIIYGEKEETLTSSQTEHVKDINKIFIRIASFIYSTPL